MARGATAGASGVWVRAAEDVWDMFGAGEETDGRDASMHSPNVKYPTEQVGPRTPVL